MKSGANLYFKLFVNPGAARQKVLNILDDCNPLWSVSLSLLVRWERSRSDVAELANFSEQSGAMGGAKSGTEPISGPGPTSGRRTVASSFLS